MTMHRTARASWPRELEIKLDLGIEDAGKLKKWLALRGSPECARQHSVYFDTPDRRLFASDLVLRIRSCGNGLVQTVKTLSPSAAGMFDRAEWEKRVASLAPVADDRITELILDPRMVAELASVFDIETARSRWMVGEQKALCLVVDEALIRADERQSAFCEVEVEIASGDATAGFALARKLDRVVPIRISVSSKAERGFRLLEPLRRGYPAESIALSPALTIREAFPQLIAACLRQYRLNETVLLDRHEPEAVHQARVALRRLRSVLALFGGMLDVRADRFDEMVRDLAREIGRLRDIDVAIGSSMFERHRDILGQRRTDAYARLVGVLRAPAARALPLDLIEWAGSRRNMLERLRTESDGPITGFATEALTRARNRLARRARHFSKLAPAKRHRVRIAAKHLRYASDSFASLFEYDHPRRTERFLRTLNRLQKELGKLNDLAVARAMLAELDGSNVPSGNARQAKRAGRRLQELLEAREFWTVA
ncbi:CHAD domain-containing protein [Stakelama marina]|uniref:CHAD domain-containing protein n=1 Tax=Stakelama marina TaxID=2826939 RepID=A0A8T4IIB7_9SPHN|nr:CHAD domain-containing protein [Stakelama marina]MBR0552049.1 CHAD domain-containing protein [Stakelama marina]